MESATVFMPACTVQNNTLPSVKLLCEPLHDKALHQAITYIKSAILSTLPGHSLHCSYRIKLGILLLSAQTPTIFAGLSEF